MSPEAFLKEFGHLAETEGGIESLRLLALDLGIAGRLGTGSRADLQVGSPLEELILHRDKVSKRATPVPPVSDAERLFEVPRHWMWTRLGAVGDWGAGATPSRSNPAYYGGEIPWFKSGELPDGRMGDSEETVTPLALEQCSLRLNQPGDVVVAMYGATIGRTGILTRESTSNQAVCACTCFPQVLNAFLFTVLRAYRRRFMAQGEGGAQPNISKVKIVAMPIALPPLPEQKRIVEKVDQLMALCDELEAKQKEKRAKAVSFNQAALSAVVHAPDKSKLKSSWSRVQDHFEVLYELPENVKELRQTILQLAVMGKLVRQGGSGASESDLPSGWTYTRGDEIAAFVDPQPSHRTPPVVLGGIPYVGMGDIRPDGFVDRAGARKVSPTVLEEQRERYQLKPGDFVIGKIGTVGRPSILPQPFDYALSANLVLVQPSRIGTSEGFVRLLLGSPLVERKFVTSTNATAQPAFGIKKMRGMLLPLPPIDEQRRIVRRVEELMTLCDDLEVKLAQHRDHGRRLMQAVVEGLVA